MIIRRFLPLALVIAMGAMPALAQEAGAANADQQAADELTGGEIDMSRIEQILKEDEDVWRGATFQYEPGNRRDPFRPLVAQQGKTKAPEQIKRPDGLPGTMIEELIVEGTIQTPEGIIAFAQGRDGRAHIIRAGTKLFDGEVRDVQNGTVVFKQYINDPKSVTPYRDVVRDISVN